MADQQQVREVTNITAESFGLQYADAGTEETVLSTNVIAVVPAPEQPSESLLLFIQSHWDASATDPNADADEEGVPKAKGAFVNRLAVRRLPASTAPLLGQFAIPKLPPHLDPTSGGRLYVVISGKSGACDSEEYFDHIVEPTLTTLGFVADSVGQASYSVHRTTSERTILDLAARVIGPQANRGAPQTILLLSGDGGAIDIINGISVLKRSDEYAKPVIGLLALGTGNALANSSGLNSDGTKGLASFLRGSPKPLPTFRATFCPGTEILSNEGRDANLIPVRDASGIGTLYGVVVASWGLHAALVADSDTTAYRKHGAERFSMAAAELLKPSDGSEPHRYQGTVTLRQCSPGGAEFNVNWERHDHMYLLATFVSNLEKSLTISPRSRPLDGQLRILHFGTLDAQAITQIFALAYDGGRHTDLDIVGYDPIQGFRIDFHEPDPRWRRVCIDGKIVRVAESGWMDVQKVADEFVELVTDA